MDAPELTLDLLADELAVCRLPVDTAIPNWAWSGELTSITSSDDELSMVCAADPVPDDVQHIPGWRALRVHGQLDFGLVGILAGLSKALADAGIHRDWVAQVTINFADDEEVLRWAGRAGCKMVFLGLEAEEVDALTTMNKRLNLRRGVDSYEKAFRRIHRGT